MSIVKLTMISVLAFITIHATAAGLEGDRELLKEVLAARSKNIGGIKTWRGKVSTYYLQEDSYGIKQYEGERDTGFLLDDAAQKMLWRPVISRDERVLRASDKYYAFHPVSAIYKDGRTQGFLHIRALNIVPSNESRRDPMKYLTHTRDFNEDISAMLTGYYEDAGTDEASSAKVYREGDLVIVEQSSDTDKTRTVFDLSKGGNAVETRHEYIGVRQEERKWIAVTEEKWTYEETGGVWLASTYSSIRSNPKHLTKDGIVKFATTTKREEFSDNILNTLIDPEEFSLESLGVKEGDRVGDRIKNIRYTYGDIENAKKILSQQELRERAKAREQAKEEAESFEKGHEIILPRYPSKVSL